MKNNRFLNIKGAVLDNISFINFMEKTAANYEIKKESNLKTYPIDRVINNYLFIEKTYNLLNEHIKKDIDIHPAGEWLLDNFYIIDETVKKIKKEMPPKKYVKLPGIAGKNFEGFARIYLLATLIVSSRDNVINDETLKIALLAYQKQKSLNMEEIWNLSTFLEIALIENIRGVCENIYSSQIQKQKAEDIIERIIEKRNSHSFKNNRINNKTTNIVNEMKYPFIEYMSYKLKRMGKRGIAYLNVLENEIQKLGFTIEDVTKKEHFNIAMQKVLIGNAITSIREISRINYLTLFEEINGTEEILKKDPAGIYNKMDYKTKAYYRAIIKEISDKTKISENYIANKVIDLANEGKKDSNLKTTHIGYYLIDEGYNTLIKSLGFSKMFYKKDNKTKVNKYISLIYVFTIAISFIFSILFFSKTSNLIYSLIVFFLTIIPISEIWIQIQNYILVKTVKPQIIPKLDLSTGIPKEYTTIVAIPTIIGNKEKVKNLMHKLEVYYLANKSENLYFLLLGDCTASKNEKEKTDDEIIQEGLEKTKELNNKYAKNKIPIFYFAYRNRLWNSGEKCFLGWERKRGLLCQLNEFLINGNNFFRINTLEGINLEFKYVITLDADTNLPLNTASGLVGAMAHILNIPQIENGVVVSGHGIMQPRVGIDLESSRNTFFSRVFFGDGGVDIYANAISDVYQDNFNEGIFTGKGIYDLEVFHKVLEKQIPENIVLSHDLLEGNYLRAGLVSDILLIDGCPEKYNSYIKRLHRWIRGDFQLIGWLKKNIVIKDGTIIKNPLNKLSRFKILDNLRRSLVPILNLILIVLGLISKYKIITAIGLVSLIFSSVLDLANYIIFKKDETNVAYKNIIKTIGSLSASFLRSLLEIAFLPNKAYKSLDAIIRSVYRLKISKQNLLEWTTSEEAENKAKTSTMSYYKEMFVNIIFGIIFVIMGLRFKNKINISFGVIWLIAPKIASIISKKIEKRVNLNVKDKEYLKKIGEKTWKYFKENMSEKNNFLPPDNYQEDRKEKIAPRTSPTNIGLRFTFNCVCKRSGIY